MLKRLVLVCVFSIIGIIIVVSNGRADEYSVSQCHRNDRTCDYRSKRLFNRCFFGTSKNNTYCCNPRRLNRTAPSKNELFNPTVCCSADGSSCFSGTLCCSGGCTRKGKKNQTVLGICSSQTPPDHNEIQFSKCSADNEAVCDNNSSPDYDSCYNGTSLGSIPSIPDLTSLTCCKSSVLQGKLPSKEQFLSETCCLPGGQTCLIDDTCCSKRCLGLQGPDTSGNCSGTVASEDNIGTSISNYEENDLNSTAPSSHQNFESTSSCDKFPTQSTSPRPPSRPKEIHHHHHYHHHYIPIPQTYLSSIYGTPLWLPIRLNSGNIKIGLGQS